MRLVSSNYAPPNGLPLVYILRNNFCNYKSFFEKSSLNHSIKLNILDFHSLAKMYLKKYYYIDSEVIAEPDS